MRGGDLRSRITFQSATYAANSFQETVATWADVKNGSAWAAVEWKSGRRFMEAKQVNAEVEGVIRIRYRSDVQAEWRISYEGRYFKILSIANAGERDRELVIWVKEEED